MSNSTGPAINPIAIYKGQTVVLPFQQVVAGTSTPEDITAHTYVFTLRRHATDAAVLLQVAADVTAPATGNYQVALTHAQTVGLAAGTYAYDVQRTDAGSEAPVSIGLFTVTQEVLYP